MGMSLTRQSTRRYRVNDGVSSTYQANEPNYSVNRTLTRCAGSRRLPQALDTGGNMSGNIAPALVATAVIAFCIGVAWLGVWSWRRLQKRVSMPYLHKPATRVDIL